MITEKIKYIKKLCERYDLRIKFLSPGQAYLDSTIQDVWVPQNQTLSGLIEQLHKVVETRGEMLSLKKELMQ